MRVFFFCQRVPFPPDRGDRIATFHLLRHMARRHEVHVFCLAADTRELGDAAGLDGLAASVTVLPRHHRAGLLRSLMALASSQPLSVAMLRESALSDAVAEAAARLLPDTLFVYSSTVAQFADRLETPARIIHFADMDSQKWQGLSCQVSIPMRWVYALEARRVLEYERHIARRFSRSLVCTQQEAEDFRRLIPDVPVGVVRNGIDLQYFKSLGGPRERYRVVFTGVMNYAPNVDAMLWFCGSILPLVRARLPGVALTICGSAPARRVRRLARIPGVTVTGRVPDVRPYLDRAALFVAPLRLGRGIQNKLLEAMAMGLPVVTTQAAWRATGIASGDGIVAADSEDGFAGAVVALLLDDAGLPARGRAARDAVAGRDWDTVLSEGGDILDTSPAMSPLHARHVADMSANRVRCAS